MQTLRLLAGGNQPLTMSELEALQRISAYVAENKINSALEAEGNLDVVASKGWLSNEVNMAVEPKPPSIQVLKEDVEEHRLDCIYDEEPLGFEKDPMAPKKMQTQDPLEEVDLGEKGDKRPTYISANIDSELKMKVISLLKEFKDCFAWDYNEMPGLSINLVEHKLPMKDGAKPVKQTPRSFALAVVSKIKEEIERLLKSKFIRTARYVEWLANIVPVLKKNGKLRVCIDFRNLNTATPKDEYAMPVAEMLVDSAAGLCWL